MRLLVVTLVALAMAASARANNEENFQRCVKHKDLTLMIIDLADRGVSRSEVKAAMRDPRGHDLVDFVFDFRGTKSNQEIAKNQMENCLRLLKVRP